MTSSSSFARRMLAKFSASTLVSHIVLSTTIAVFPVASLPAYAVTSEGPNSGDVFANDTTVGTENWSGPSDAASSNNDHAVANLEDFEISRYLKATDFDFSIPNGAIIKGIKVDVERKAETSNRIKDSSVRIVKGGTIGSTDKADTSTFWGTSENTYVSYGSSTDLWGETWTAADINATNFGFVFAAVKDSSADTDTEALVDHIRITVYYNDASPCGTNVGSTFTNVTFSGSDHDWDNESDAVDPDGEYANVDITSSSNVSDYLRATGFGFAIPNDATIDGITVCFDRHQEAGGGENRDSVVKLVKNNVVVGDNKAATGTNWPTSDAVATYGGAADLWGTSWTPSDINNANFGVVLSVGRTSGGNSEAFVDYFSITVSYTVAPTTGTIVIVKDAVPDDAQDFVFASDVTGHTSFTLDDDADGTHSNTETMNSVTAGTYNVSETVPGGWTQTSATCSDGSPVTAIDLAAGETVTCTFTNTKLGTVTIVKDAVPDDSQSFDFTTTLPAGSFSLVDDGEGEGVGSVTYTNVALGSYTITEGADPTDWNLTGLNCSGGDADYSTDVGTRTATIDVDAGENITCTFTNTKNGVLRIQKYAYGGDETFDFDVDGEGNPFHSDESITTVDGEGTVDVSVAPGEYNVTETLPNADWTMEVNNCMNQNVTAGATTTCWIRNTKKAHVEIRKETTDGYGTFDFHGNSDGEDDVFDGESGFSLTTAEGDNPKSRTFDFFVDSEGSSIHLTENESGEDGWMLTSRQCTIDDVATGESSGESAYDFTLQPGQTAICTYVNDKAICGNSDVEENEQCDDGNTDAEDGCSATCQIESGWACDLSEPSICTTNCGDGVTAGVEQCDDDGNEDGDGCSAVCVIEYCGDGVINNSTETCDDSNATAGDGCSASCTIEEGYSCPTEGDSCTTVCGDGLVRGAETCDDGDLDTGDGCSMTCGVETGYSCENNELSDPNSTCQLNLDFGDAPDAEGPGYPVTLSDDGARHVQDGQFLLGATVDGEPDGQPSADATGDGSDEDGVSFTNTLIPGSTGNVTAVVTTDGESSGYLQGWLDFNADGDWDDEGEQIFEDVQLAEGSHDLTFSIPSDATVGQTFARFRWSHTSELGLTGLAMTGEVEDYAVTISPVPTETQEETSSSSSSSVPGEDNPGNGSSRGAGTNDISGATDHALGNTPPGAFGGTEGEPLSDAQKNLLKIVIQHLSCQANDSDFHAVAILIAPAFGGNVAFAESSIHAMCDELSSLPGGHRPVAVKVAPRIVELAADGYPVSSNRVWNLCVRGTATLADIRSNTDFYVRNGRKITRSCDWYRTSGTAFWKYPDDPFLTISIQPGKNAPPSIGVSQGYAVAPLQNWTAEKQTDAQ